ncbi:bifunctional D-alanyl-alanine synthetase A/UDP-N-acetylmuramate--L-alanine ligase [Chlamydia abortus]|uniref:D-alanine--D-alanine ligase n=1 Tax=Paenibacillus residui TaxID=629724 RepID=A0ABW3DBH4_9BACL|nr:bifunctional D-alanyl-alanine synthetase A/UDP-N-acetylmuramate--L-alanine ligase [Chlamydia abortus]
MDKKIRVGLVYGGRSGEHDVSLQTALAVIQAFDHSKYEVYPFYITKQGEWRTGKALNGPVGNLQALISPEQPDASSPDKNDPSGIALMPLFASGGAAETAVTEAAEHPGTLDVIFPLLHGTYGEDGTLQGMLEMANIPYVGAGVLASAVGMDKVTMKKLFAQEGLPQCIYRHFTKAQWAKDQAFFLMEIEVAVGYPCFVKPANLGSSVGVSKASDREELLEAVQLAFKYDRKVIVEEYVSAREIEVGVLGNEEPEVSVAGEIVSSNDFYDYKAKYIDGKSAMIIPAELPEEKAQQIRELALRAFQAIDGSGLARVDFFLDKASGQVYINEINTMPGFTPFSMYPLLWKASGKTYPQLLDDLIRLAFQRHEDKNSIQYTFDEN